MTKRNDNLPSWLEPNNEETLEAKGVARSDAISPFDDEIDSFFGNINDLSNRFLTMTKKIVGQTCDHHRSLPRWWQSRDADEDQNNGVDYFFSRPYQTHSSSVDHLEPFSILSRAPFDFFKGFTESSGVTPFGLFAYQGPSPKEYNTCMKKNGVSLWDNDGYWRCLFPNSQVPAKFLEYKRKHLTGQIVTKDDFEKDARSSQANKDGAIDLGPKGVFFKLFNDLLNWQNSQYETARETPARQTHDFSELCERKPNSSSEAASLGVAGEKRVIGTSSQTSTNIELGEVVSEETKTEYFSDGTSITNSVLKRKPQGADVWASVEEKSEQGDNKPGWFWNSK